jgi:hypothetical protein
MWDKQRHFLVSFSDLSRSKAGWFATLRNQRYPPTFRGTRSSEFPPMQFDVYPFFQLQREAS